MLAPYKPKAFRFNIELYSNHEIIFVVCCDTEPLIKFIEQNMPGALGVTEELLDAHNGISIYSERPITLIWARTFDTCDAQSLGTLCHESLHAAFDICRKVGIYLGEEDLGKEALAYLQTFIFRKCFQMAHAYERKHQ